MSQSSSFTALPAPAQYALQVISGASFVFVLVTVNMVGYAVGTNGWNAISDKLTGAGSVLGWSFYFLTCAVGCMMFLRREGFSHRWSILLVICLFSHLAIWSVVTASGQTHCMRRNLRVAEVSSPLLFLVPARNFAKDAPLVASLQHVFYGLV